MSVARAMRKKRFQIYLLLFGIIFFNNIYFYPAVDYDNSKSRFLLLSSVVDYQRLNLGRYAPLTIDKSVYDGKYYSNKAFGAPLAAAPIYWTLRKIPFLNTSPLDLFTRYAVTAMTTGLLSAICCLFMFRFVLSLDVGMVSAILMVMAYAFGSIAWIHSTMFSGHVMAASFLFIGFYLLWTLNRRHDAVAETKRGGDPKACFFCFLSGAIVGLAGLCDYTAIFMAVFVAVYVLFAKMDLCEKLSFFAGASCLALLLLSYNWKCFGSPLSFSYAHNAMSRFSEGSKQGFLGIGLPNIAVLFQLLLSPHRGLFFMMPVFLFSIFGAIAFFRQKRPRSLFYLFSALVACNIWVNAGFYGWHGGWSSGPRYLTVMLPFLSVFMAFKPLNNIYFYLLFAISFFHVFPGVAFFPYAPEHILNPQMEIVLPLIKSGYSSINLGMLMGLSKGSSLLLWLSVSIFFLSGILTVLAKNKYAKSEESTTVGNYFRLASFALALYICTGLAFVKSDMRDVNEYRNVLLTHFAKSKAIRIIYPDAGKR